MTCNKTIKLNAGTGFWSLAGLALAVLIGLAALPSSAQPLNDNFEAAQVITGPVGSLSGTTQGATRESGEPNHYTVSTDASVWFSWTAPTNGAVTFNTAGSIFDTVLAVYTGTAVNALTLVVRNDDYLGLGLDSRVDFNATAGVDYRIALAGYFNSRGFYFLNWQMEGVSTNVTTTATNEVQFALTSFTVQEDQPGYATIGVNYGGGAAGPVTVDYATADGTALAGSDYLASFGTLTFDVGQSNKTFTVGIIDNAFVASNKTFQVFLTNVTGGAVFGPVTNAEVVIVDDESVTIVSTAGEFNFSQGLYSVTEYETLRAPYGAYPINYRNVPGALITVTRTAGSTGRVLVDYAVTNLVTSFIRLTNVVIGGVTNFILVTNFVNSATPGIDYIAATGTLVFDDYQMSTNFLVPVFSDFIPTNGIHTVQVQLSNPRPAPGENPFVIRPTLGPVTNASVAIVEIYRIPLFSIERATWRTDEYPDAHQVPVEIIYPPGCSPCSVRFRTLNLFGFLQQAGSDYAMGFERTYPDTPHTDGGVNTPEPQDFEPQNEVVGPFPDGRNRSYITITNDSAPEFNEDIYVEIIPVPSNPGVNPLASDAVVTILYDDQPAGIADREWNPWFVTYTTPPLNRTPGANNNVNAVVVTEDGKSIIGGDFTAYNSATRNRIAQLNPDGSLDPFFMSGTGADGPVQAVAVYRTSTNSATLPFVGRVIMAGNFSSVDGQLRNGIARLNRNGSLDTSFRPGAGANGPIYSVQILDNGKVIIAGGFTTFDNVPRNRLARLNVDGSIDLTYDPGSGANDTVWSVALEGVPPPIVATNGQSGLGPQENRLDIEVGRNQGLMTVVWDFQIVPDRMTAYYDGALIFDTGYTNNTFDTNLNQFIPVTNQFAFGPGVDTKLTIVMNEGGNILTNTVWAYAVRVEFFGKSEKLLVGGDFTAINGVRLGHIARLLPNGTVDGSFNAGGGFDGPVYGVASTGSDQVLAVGDFHTIDFRNRNNIARLNADGSVDETFQPGSGFDAPAYTVTMDFEGRAVVGGIFKDFNQTRRVGLARLNTDGSVDTSFMDTAYNQFAGVINQSSFQPPNFIRSIAADAVGGYIIGGSFTNIGGGNAFEINEQNALEVNNSRSYTPVWTRQDKTIRFNVARVIGGYTRGPGNVQYTFPQYTADENINVRYVTTERINGRLGTAMGLFATTNVVAVGGSDFSEVKTNIIWPEFQYVGPISIGNVNQQYLSIPIQEDSLVEGDETVLLGLVAPQGSITLAGEVVPLGVGRAISIAPLTIVDNDFDKGTLVFEKRVFTVNENGTNALISVVRTNGTDGQVSVTYFVRDGRPPGSRAHAGADYTNVLTGTLTFVSGNTNQSFLVPLINDSEAEVDENVSLILTNATGGAILPGGLDTSTDEAVLTIIDDDYSPGRINFSSLTYATNESAGLAIITVERLGGNQGPVSAEVIVGSGSAVAGVDFTGFTTNLAWVNGDTTPKTFAVPLIDDLVVETNETATLTLTNGRAGGVPDANTIGSRSEAVLTIENDDFAGELAFSQAFFDADENGTNVSITVVRKNGVAGMVQVDYVANSGDATPGVDYVPTTGTLTFGPGVISRTFPITLLDDSVSDANKKVDLLLTNVVNGALGVPAAARLTIIDDETFNIPAGTLDSTFNTAAGANNAVYQLALQPDGRVIMAGDFTAVNDVTRRRIARLFDNGDLDPTFNAGTGPNAPVRAMVRQDDGRLLIGGFFTQVHGTNRNHIARLLKDGTLDISFNPGAGADNTVYAVALMADGRAVIGGSFNTVNGISRPNIAVLNTNGSLYTGFNPNLGANGAVYAVAVQEYDGRILIGGDFTTVNNIPRPRLARLLPNGALDLTFDPGEGASSSVRAITVQPDGRILIGGSFTSFAGTNRNFMARLEPNGVLDQAFLGTLDGGDNAVYGITLQSDNKILVVGDFTKFNGVTRNRITRLNQNGKTDPTINFGEGANSFIAQAILQPDRKIVVGGGFTRIQGESRNRVARLHGGSIAGPGSVEFTAPFFTAVEDQGQVNITIRRAGGTTGDIQVDYATSDLTALNGLDYAAVSGTLNFPEGEVLQSFAVSITNDTLVEPAEMVQMVLSNPTEGATLGLIPEATLAILSEDSVVSFVTSTYSVSENSAAGYALITVARTGTTNAAASVDYLSLSGTATAGIDYSNVSGTLTFAVGETLKTFNVPINPDVSVEGDETVQLLLTNATAGVQYLIASATLTIVEDDFAPGALGFSSLTYSVNEYETNAVITIIRTNGTTGIVSVNYQTIPGTATSPGDYLETSGVLTFADGETLKTFNVPIVGDYLQETNNETVQLGLDNSTGGATLVNNAATLTIVDNNLINGSFSFSATDYVVNESNLVAALTVRRNFGATGEVSVTFATYNGTALAGTDYVPVTNTLVWTNGESAPKTALITLINDPIVESSESFGVRIYNPTGKASLGLFTNATVLVVDDDFGPGNLGFVSATFVVDENGTNAAIEVVRTFGITGTVAIDAATVAGGTAVPGRDYLATNTTLTFPDGVTNATFLVPVIGNIIIEGNRTINLALSNPRNLTTPTNPPSTNGQIIAAVLTILENFPQAGSIDASFATLDPNGPINTILFQTNDSKIVIGGSFTAFAGVPRGYVARLNPNGTLDNSFDAGAAVNHDVFALARQSDGRVYVGGAFTTTNAAAGEVSYLMRLGENGLRDTNFFSAMQGVDNLVYAVAVQTDGKVIAGGLFTGVNGVPRQYLARLETDGALDYNFTIASGPNAAVRAVRVQQDGKVLVAGDFTAFHGIGCGRLVRLTQDGQMDPGFDSSLGANGSIRALVLQPDGRVIIAGLFTLVNGQPRQYVARLNGDGTLDATFDPGAGPDEFINGLALQPDGRILAVGAFTEFAGTPRNHIVRLNPDGSVDDSINFGSGADNYINAVALQTDRKILIGGGFTEFDGQPRRYVARLNGGENIGNGEFVFSAANYAALETAPVVTITVRRIIGSSNDVSVAFSTSDGTAVAGVNYLPTNGVIHFGPGETVATFDVSLINDAAPNTDRTINLTLSNPTGGATLGVPSAATIRLVNDDAILGFSSVSFTASENVGNAVITVQRLSSTVGVATVNFATSDGTANGGADYLGVTGTLTFADGQRLATFTVPIVNDGTVEGNETVNLALTGATGAALGVSAAVLVIVDDDSDAGVITFSQPVYLVGERSGSVTITVQRQNGVSGTASVRFRTTDGTALNGLDYRGTNGLLVFADGQAVRTFTVSVFADALMEGPETVQLALYDVQNARLGSNAQATVTILDDDISFRFENANYRVPETAGSVNVQVIRVGLPNGVVSVNFATSDGTAISPGDYGFTSTRVVFADGQTNALVTIPIRDDALGEGLEIFYLNLDSPTNGTSLGLPSQAVMEIVDNEDTISFAQAGYPVDEGASNVVVTVRRTGGSGGLITVSYTTSNLTATAGIDYTSATNFLSFTPFEFEKDIVIPIVDDALPEGDETFLVRLFNPSGTATVVAPSNTVVTILDNDTVVQFTSVLNSVAEEVTPARIQVERVGGLNSTVRVDYFTTNGTATTGVDYQAVAGTLVFLPGQTNLAIDVPIIDDLLFEGNETVHLRLVNQTNAIMGARSNTVLTIVDTDASILVAAGSAIMSESVPANGVIDPNETVTINFGLRNIGKVDTANLIATLLSTNGIQPQAPLPQAQNYGVVAAGGNTVSRQFTFKAVGTNGARIAATLQLVDGANNLGQVAFSFTLGRGTALYTSTGAITITSPTNGAPALPYPSVIDVAGLTGSVSKVAVTLNNLSHTFAQDLDIMLVGPAGQKVILMSDAGGAFAINNATLNFDDAATAGLPFNTLISSGTYRPTNYVSADSWPPPAPAGAFSTALSAFNGTSPQGQWSLYVVDDTLGDEGNIAGGWSLNFTISDIITPTADLLVRVTDSPDPVMVGAVVNYTVAVTNFGPAAATGVVLSNQLPAGVTFLTATPSQGSCSQAAGVITCNVGSLSSGASATVTIAARTTVPGLITDVAGVSGGQVDLNLADNVHSAKTTVSPLTVTFGRQGNNLVISWPVGVPGVVLQASDTIQPAHWLPVNQAPVQAGGLNVVIINPTGGHQFYRLRTP